MIDSRGVVLFTPRLLQTAGAEVIDAFSLVFAGCGRSRLTGPAT